jgi:hypothetical protein
MLREKTSIVGKVLPPDMSNLVLPILMSESVSKWVDKKKEDIHALSGTQVVES